jgi:hypothetical protein
MKNLSEVNIAAISLEEALEHPEIVSRISVYCEKQKEYLIVFKAAEATRNNACNCQEIPDSPTAKENIYMQDLLREAKNLLDRSYHDIFYSYKD